MTEPGPVERLATAARNMLDPTISRRQVWGNLKDAFDALAPLCPTCGGTGWSGHNTIEEDPVHGPRPGITLKVCPNSSCVNGRDYTLVRLADAAPKLAEALQEVIDHTTSGARMVLASCGCIDRARAALSATRGESV